MDFSFFKSHLTNDLIPFWNKLCDLNHGGFYGLVDENLNIIHESDKGVILNSRILWFYSNAYLTTSDNETLNMAKHAYDFLCNHCCDKEYGGIFWSVKYDGTFADTTKHTYNQAFAIYSLSSYYKASKDSNALNLALSLYKLIEEKCRDTNGYLESFSRDFTPDSNDKLSENGVMALRTMNTLLHVMEAYTELYSVCPTYCIKESLFEILDILENKIYNPQKQICDVFFDLDYNSLIDLESFGHNIECSWLLDRTCKILDSDEYTKKMKLIVNGLAESSYNNAFAPNPGILYNERENDKVDKKIVWWVQAEALVGFYNTYLNNPHEEKYLIASESICDYIKNNIIDVRCGEWFENILEDGSKDLSRGIVHAWKCPYHNGRMCMEMIKNQCS